MRLPAECPMPNAPWSFGLLCLTYFEHLISDPAATQEIPFVAVSLPLEKAFARAYGFSAQSPDATCLTTPEYTTPSYYHGIPCARRRRRAGDVALSPLASSTPTLHETRTAPGQEAVRPHRNPATAVRQHILTAGVMKMLLTVWDRGRPEDAPASAQCTDGQQGAQWKQGEQGGAV